MYTNVNTCTRVISNNNNSIQFNSIQFRFINVPSQQPDGQLQKQHNKQTQITMDMEQDKIDKHNKTNK
jgi:uncharacterized phage protein gp47/JayE